MGPCSRSVLITFTVRVTKQHSAAHWCFNSYATELVPIFYSAIKHGYRCFIS